MGTNELLLVPISTDNTESDAALRSAWQVESKGIGVSEIAYSKRLNAILRQLSTVTNSVVDLVLIYDTSIKEIGSKEDNMLTRPKLEQGLVNLVLANAENKNTPRGKNTFWSGPTTGDNAKPEFRALDAADIPNLDTSKITTGTLVLDRFADNLITLKKLVQIPGISILGKTAAGDGDITPITAGTNGHILTRRGNTLTFGFIVDENIENNTIDAKKLTNSTITDQKLKDASVTNTKLASGAVSKDKLENQAITKSKLNYTDEVTAERILTGAGGVLAEHMLDKKYRSVIGFGDSSFTIREITSADFNALSTKDPRTIYLVV